MKKSASDGNKATSSSNNIYDIICYYNETEDDEPQHVKEVISKIEKANQRIDGDGWIKWKLLGCLVINVLLSAPIYSYGTIYLQKKEAFDEQPALIWPPIIFNSVYLLVTPWLFNTISTPASRNSRAPPADSSIFAKLTNKSVIIVFTLILCASISIGGFAFTHMDSNVVVILIFYSVFGGEQIHIQKFILNFKQRTYQLHLLFLSKGMSSCIIMGKLFVLINGILNNDRLHMINFIYSFGQALTQFLFPFLIQLSQRWVCHNCTLMLIGALMLHIIPITMLVVKNKISIKLRQQQLPATANPHEESRYSDISAISFDFCVDIKYPSDVFDMDNKWKNPSSCKDEGGKVDNFLEDLDSNRVMNSDGVEILQTILETDEEAENKFPVKVTIDDNDLTDDAIESIYEEINRKHEHRQQEAQKPSQCGFMRSFVWEKLRSVATLIYRQIVNPLRRSFRIFKFYPSVILKSCDIFSYLLFITLILPNLALKQYRFEDRGKVIYLITVMGFCWILYALLVLRFHNLLRQSCIHYFHMAGLLGKFFGYLCKKKKNSKFENFFNFKIKFESFFNFEIKV